MSREGYEKYMIPYFHDFCILSRVNRVVRLVKNSARARMRSNKYFSAVCDARCAPRATYRAPHKRKINSNEKTLYRPLGSPVRSRSLPLHAKVLVSRFRRHQNVPGVDFGHEATAEWDASFRYLGHVPSGPLGAFLRRGKEILEYLLPESHGHL